MSIDTRQALLDAAERAILQDGFARASTRRIAGEAGVPLSLLHYHFGGKESLLVALVERRRDHNRDAVLKAIEEAERGTAPPGAALAAAKRALVEDEAGMRLLVEVSVAALHNPRLRSELGRLYAETMASLCRVPQPAHARDATRGSKESTPEAVASLVLATGLGLALQRMLGMPRAAAESAFDMLTTLLQAEPEGTVAGSA
jgi:AcrR family transcriptional regulator